MPFFSVNLPSIALTQLKEVLEREFGDSVDVNIFYLNHDFAKLVGLEIYEYMDNYSIQTGIGDWFFRNEAFPDESDNLNEYFKRYGYMLSELIQRKDEFEKLRKNLGVFLEDLILKNELYSSDVVGFTSQFTQNIPSLALAKKLKDINPNVKIVIGGSNCEYPMGIELIKNIEYIDYIFSGQALESFPQFVKNMIEENPDKNENIDGVFSRSNVEKYFTNGTLNSNVQQKNGKDSAMNEFLLLDYYSYFDSYRKKVNNVEKPGITIETSKGCWWGEKIQCSFCGLNGSYIKHRAMDAKHACEYLNWHINEYYQYANIIICTDLVLPKNYIEKVFPKLDVSKNISIFYEVRPDIKEEELKLLASKNINKIQPGIEALSTPLLKIMHKGVSGANNIKLLKNCVNYSMEPAWNLLIGFPGDNEKIYKFYYDTLSFLFHLPPPNLVPVRFDRFSEYHKDQEKHNLDLKPYDFYELIYPFDKDSLSNLAYYFADFGDNGYIDNLIKWEEKLKVIVNKWNYIWNKNKTTVMPTLSYINNNQIVDTRSGSKIIHDLNEVSKTILSLLRNPLKKELAILKMDTLSENIIEKEWEKLKKNGLIFHEENQQAISLVL
jgi:ribosomal peptide maturation radical SAM protein 1